jgi:hypothetical protein
MLAAFTDSTAFVRHARGLAALRPALVLGVEHLRHEEVVRVAAAARIDPSEKHRSPNRNTPQTARISRHGREGISYPSGYPPARGKSPDTRRNRLDHELHRAPGARRRADLQLCSRGGTRKRDWRRIARASRRKAWTGEVQTICKAWHEKYRGLLVSDAAAPIPRAHLRRALAPRVGGRHRALRHRPRRHVDRRHPATSARNTPRRSVRWSPSPATPRSGIPSASSRPRCAGTVKAREVRIYRMVDVVTDIKAIAPWRSASDDGARARRVYIIGAGGA